MITIAICDDDTQNLSETKEQITAWAKEQDIEINIKTMDNGDALLNYCSRKKPDIILLDIIMPSLSAWML